MLDNRNFSNLRDSTSIPVVRTPVYIVQKFRFIPESYLLAVGAHWDTGLDELVYLRTFIEEEIDEAFQQAGRTTVD